MVGRLPSTQKRAWARALVRSRVLERSRGPRGKRRRSSERKDTSAARAVAATAADGHALHRHAGQRSRLEKRHRPTSARCDQPSSGQAARKARQPARPASIGHPGSLDQRRTGPPSSSSGQARWTTGAAGRAASPARTSPPGGCSALRGASTGAAAGGLALGLAPPPSPSRTGGASSVSGHASCARTTGARRAGQGGLAPLARLRPGSPTGGEPSAPVRGGPRLMLSITPGVPLPMAMSGVRAGRARRSRRPRCSGGGASSAGPVGFIRRARGLHPPGLGAT